MTSPSGPEELRYFPVSGDVEGLLAEPVSRLLVVGSDVPPTVDFDRTEVRLSDATETKLPMGVYRFVEDDGIALLLVADGDPPGTPISADWEAPDGNPLVNAYGWLSAWWEGAHLVPRPKFDEKDEAHTVPEGQLARILGRRYFRTNWMYRIRVEGKSGTRLESALTTAEYDDDPFEWITRAPGDVNRFAATLTRAKLDQELTDTVFSFRATRTLFRPYQFRPVMRLLETGSLRLLIADEVGLGKTIEAGLVWTELDARRAANRVLVVCPSMLVPKWRAEMEERFGYELDELNKDRLDDLLERVDSDRLPKRYHAISSVERLRVWGGLDRLAELAPRFDLIIADEAHVFRNTGTASNALGVQLSDWADALVFLSATPLNLGNSDLYNLLELLAPGEFDNQLALEQRLEPNAVLHRIAASLLDREVTNDARNAWLQQIGELTFGPAVTARQEYRDLQVLLSGSKLSHGQVADARRLIGQLHALSAVVTRTRKVEIQEKKAVREAIPIHVEWTDEEAEFYVAYDAWQRDRARRKGLPTGFVIQMPLRLASTCLPAARELVLNGAPSTDVFIDLDEVAEDSITAAARQAAEDVDVPPHDVLAAARALPEGIDTKYDAFVERLLPILDQGKQVLVFTFSRPTLAYLQRRLSAHIRLCVLHGGVTDKAARHETMRRFRTGEYQVMLASRVASEGLDFEFCSAVVNYDLPWNPMEVEQRIGRIDRFGQVEEKVLILNFHTPGTIETDIFQRLHQRIGVFTDSIGELEPIIQSKLADIQRVLFDFNLSPAQRELQLDQMLTAIEEQRLTRDEVERATSFLASTDQAEIDGLEDELVSQGRYVGQPELALLLQDWVDTDPDSSCHISTDGTHVIVRGSEKLEAELRGVQAAGERSAAELETLARGLRNQMEIHICLDQEMARATNRPLLTTNHPLVRAALRVPGHQQVRFAHLAATSDEVEAGRYLVLLSLAKWTGMRASTELWTSAVSLDRPEGAPTPAVGAAVLSALAEAALEPAVDTRKQEDLAWALQTITDDLLDRQQREQTRRLAANGALIDTRRISLQETHRRKCNQIRRRIATLLSNSKTRMIHLNEAQLRNQDRLLDTALSELEASRSGAMQVDPLAVALVTMSRPLDILFR